MVPREEIGPNESVLGEVEDGDVRKLYSLAIQWKKIRDESALAAKYATDDATRDQNISRVVEYNKKSELLMDSFWVSVKDSLGIWDKPCIHLRKGWKVVSSEPDPDRASTLIGLLHELLRNRQSET
jgi:hypothetical protein